MKERDVFSEKPKQTKLLLCKIKNKRFSSEHTERYIRSVHFTYSKVRREYHHQRILCILGTSPHLQSNLDEINCKN